VLLRLPSPLERLDDERADRAGVTILLKRDDLIHPDFPGNKWRKLKYNIEAARTAGARTLLTFGGAYSNHILATAAAGHHYSFATVGVIRGERHDPLNPVLARATELGMTLTYVSRARYRDKPVDHDAYVIPEGGANDLAVTGCAELVGEIDRSFDVLCCSVGTGATLAGVATALEPGQRAVGFAALKGDFLADEVRRLQGTPTTNWTVDTGFHFGGFARTTPALTDFTDDFRVRHGIALDRVYEAKMMYALLERGRVTPGTTVVALIA
jgi:1-aminocyclopropane-1-carboxylate deaminase